MENNREIICPNCGTTNYGVIHSCLKCGALLPQGEDAETQAEFVPPNRFEAPTIIETPPEPDAYVEITSGPDEGNRYAIVHGLTFGRSRDCDIVIDSPKASREHARIELNTQNQWQLVDLGSTNGTIHNGKMANKPVALENGDEIKIGEYTLRVHLKQPVAPPSPLLIDQTDETPPENQPIKPLPERKGCLSNTALIIIGVVLIFACMCVVAYFGVNFILDQGWF
jgi:hypothetical protein